jgi:hypothetical protein
MIAIKSKPKSEYKQNQQEKQQHPSSPMRAIKLMSSVPDPPNLIILGATHPTPLLPTSSRTRRTLDMITPIHLLNPTTTVARFGIRSKPHARLFVGSKEFVAKGGPVFGAGDVGVCRSTALKARSEPTG